MLHKSFNSAKCKTSLKLAASRMKLLKNKRQQTASLLRREISKLLEAGQDQTARIRVEHVIREEKTIAAYEFIEVFCELIAARLQIIESQKACPIDLKEAIASVIFASQRCPDVTELSDVRKRLAAKYGKEFVAAALELRPNCGVSSLMVEKLSAKTPDIETKLHVLTAIATEYGINWEPKSFEEQLKKPQDERLDGPSSFGAVKTATEPTTSVFSVQSSLSNEPARQASEKEMLNSVTYSVSVTGSSVPAKPPEKEVQSPVTHSTSSTNSSVSTKYQTEPRSSEPRYQPEQSENSYSRGMDDASKLEKWNSKFKDASAAARAAAESAERASLAARAAAEFASQETRSREFVTGHGEMSQTIPEIVSTTSKAEKVQDPGFNSNRMKETLRVSKLSEHHSSEVMHHDSRAKNKAKEDLEGPRSSSNCSKSPSPPSSDIDKPDPTFIVAGRSSQRITAEHVTQHGLSSSQMMQDDLIEKYSAVSVDEEEDEMEEHFVRSDSSHNHREDEHLVRSNSSHHYRAYSDDDKLSFSKDRVGNNVHEEGGTQNTEAQSSSEKGSSSFKSISSSLDGSIHSAMQSGKNDFYGRESFEIYDETRDKQDNQQGISGAVFDDYGPDDGDYTNVFNTSHDNVELDILKYNSEDSLLNQDPWLCKDARSEPSIERHVHSHIFSPETAQAENIEDEMEGSVLKFNEAPSPKYDEPLSPNYDEIDAYDNSDSEDDKLSHCEEGKSTSTSVSYHGREGSLNLHSNPEDQFGQGLKLDSISGGFKNKGLVRPPYVRGIPESHLSKEGVDDPSERRDHSRKSISEKFLDEKATTVESTSFLSKNFEHSSDRLLGRDVYGKKSHDDFGRSKADPQPHSHLEYSSNDRLFRRGIYGEKSYGDDDDDDDVMEQASESSRDFSDFGSSKEDRQPRGHFQHSLRDQLSGRHVDGKKSYDEDGAEQGFKSPKQYSDFSSSKENSQPHSPVASRRTIIVAQSRRTKGPSMSNSESRSISDQLDGESLDTSSQQDTKTETKPPQSRFNDVKSRWNGKYSSKQLQDEGAESIVMPNEQDTEKETKPPLSRFNDVKSRWNSKYSSKQLQDEGTESIDMSNEQDTEDTKPPLSRSDDVKSRWNSKYSSKRLQDDVIESSQQMDELSIKESSGSPWHDLTCTVDVREEMKTTSRPELHSHSYKKAETEISSQSAPRSTVLADPGTPSKPDARNRWNSKYSQPSEKRLAPQVQTDEVSGRELHASPSTVQATAKEMPELLDGSSSKSDMRNRWSNRYSPSQPYEERPAQRNVSSKKELHAALPSTVQPRTKGSPESSDGSSTKSDVQKRWSNKYTTSQPSEKNWVPPVQRNESPKKELRVAASAVLPGAKGVPEALDMSSSKSNAQMRWNDKYVPPPPSEKYVASPVQTREVSGKESQALPPSVQPMTKGISESPDGSVKKEKQETQSSRQPSSTQPEGMVRTTSGSEVAGVQNIRSDLASATSSDGVESPRSQESMDGPLRHVHPKLPDYDAFAARFKSLKSNQRKK